MRTEKSLDCSKTDCFGINRLSHKCRILTDTDFNGRECPFYKPSLAMKLLKPKEAKKDLKMHSSDEV